MLSMQEVSSPQSTITMDGTLKGVLDSSQSTFTMNSTLQGMLDREEYLNLTSTLVIPIDIPYPFNDNFVLFTEAQLQAMSDAELSAYGDTVSTTVGLEYSTLTANQNINNTYALFIQLSQSTIDGLSYENELYTASNYAIQQRRKFLQSESTLYSSKIAEYDYNINLYTQTILDENANSIALSNTIQTMDLAISQEMSTFITSAERYSSLYIKYIALDSLAVDKQIMLDETSNALSTYKYIESTLYKSYLDSTVNWTNKTNELSTLYATSNVLQYALNMHIINETIENDNYNSSITALSMVSTTYSAAFTNMLYMSSIDAVCTMKNKYKDALSTFTSADLEYQKYNTPLPAVSQGGGILAQARSMAQQAMQAALNDMYVAEETTSMLQTLANIVNTSYYNATLDALEATVVDKTYLANTFMKYKLSSLDEVIYYSSIYENANIDANIFGNLVNVYSTLYESSIIGSSTLTGLAQEDEAEIQKNENEADIISYSIRTLTDVYDDTMNSYNKYLFMSTFHTHNLISSIDATSTLSSLYYSTQIAINDMNITFNETNKLLIYMDTDLYVQSSILNSETINLLYYDMLVKDNVNIQERAAYEYRETYCQLKRIDIQNSYEQKILSAVQAASTATIQAQALSTTPIQPIAANLNTQDIVNTYTSLTNINNFLLTFSKVYNAYDTQMSNIEYMSTSIGDTGNAWSTLKTYDQAFYYSGYTDKKLESFVNAAHLDFASKQYLISDAIKVYSTGQDIIGTIKYNTYSNYVTLFSPREIEQQESTISTFIIEGYLQASSNLTAAGL
jgi:hypothetical protein